MKKLRALVIDDEEYLSEVLARMLETLDFEVDTAMEGEKALDLLNKFGYDIILCDLNLPLISGLTLLKKAKEIQPETVVIMITGFSTIDSALEATRLGAYDYLTKPFNLNQVHLSIQRGIENRKLLQSNKELLEKMQKLNKELEQKVEERTRELRLAYKQLQEMDTLKDNFLSLVSHELNSPLTLITGYLELFGSNVGDFNKEELIELMSNVSQGANRLKQIVEDILSLTRLETGKMLAQFQEVSLVEILENNLLFIKEVVEERELKIIFHKPKSQILVMGDPVRLQQACQNLFNNAVKYTPNQKRIWVSLKKIQNGWAELTIKDEGIGIPQAIGEKIFLPFFEGTDILQHSTGESKFLGGGLGLGLPISQRIIQSHGGRITFKSEGNDQGSTFIVRLPLRKIN